MAHRFRTMAKRNTTASGYGAAHQRERARWKPLVDAGQADCHEIVCLMPRRWIPPGTRWHLAHDRTNGGYLGPAHPLCNNREGAREGNRRQRTRRRAPRAQSRNW